MDVSIEVVIRAMLAFTFGAEILQEETLVANTEFVWRFAENTFEVSTRVVNVPSGARIPADAAISRASMRFAKTVPVSACTLDAYIVSENVALEAAIFDAAMVAIVALKAVILDAVMLGTVMLLSKVALDAARLDALIVFAFKILATLTL